MDECMQGCGADPHLAQHLKIGPAATTDPQPQANPFELPSCLTAKC